MAAASTRRIASTVSSRSAAFGDFTGSCMQLAQRVPENSSILAELPTHSALFAYFVRNFPARLSKSPWRSGGGDGT
jgi:hypothetical protein